MRQDYTIKPSPVDVFLLGDKTDIILRKDIQAEARTGEDGKRHTVWTCEERQVRAEGVVSLDKATTEFDLYWSEAGGERVERPTTDERLSALEAAMTELILG